MADCLYRTCSGCGGTGIQNIIVGGTGSEPVWDDVICPQCNGDKLIPWGDIEGLEIEGIQDIIDAIVDVADKCTDIKEVVDEIKTIVDAL